MLNFYRVYGLKIKSEYKFDELIRIRSTNEVDVVIKKGKMDNTGVEYPVWLSIGKEEVKIRIDNTAIIKVSKGREILVDEDKGCRLNRLKLYILGSALGVIMKQRNELAIHGGAVNLNNKGIIISGVSGAGKSTLINGLIQKGYKYLSDDVSVIREKQIIPSFPQQKLCKDTIKKFKYDSNLMTKIEDDRDKFAFKLREVYYEKPLDFKAMVIIKEVNSNNVELKELIEKDKLEGIIKNIYRIEFFKESNMFDIDYYKKCIEFSREIRVFKLERPKNKFSIDKQIMMIEDLIEEL